MTRTGGSATGLSESDGCDLLDAYYKTPERLACGALYWSCFRQVPFNPRDYGIKDLRGRRFRLDHVALSSNGLVHICEVKCSRGDLARGLTRRQWEAARMAHGYYFCNLFPFDPAVLAARLPEHIGILGVEAGKIVQYRDSDAWRVFGDPDPRFVEALGARGARA